MSEVKHTPGPWHCTPEADLPRIGVYAGKDDEDDEAIICDVTDEDLKVDGENEANARLIAAAPDLLEALEIVQNGINGSLVHGIPEKLERRIKAAIAKATGEGS